MSSQPTESQRRTWETKGANASPAIWCEILPITLADGQIVHVQRQQDGASAAWYEPHSAVAHPSDAVRACVEMFFGATLDACAAVVHSTAWRYEPSDRPGGRLILTYLAILPPLSALGCARTSGQITLVPVGTGLPARSGTLVPPEQISLAQVLAHALDHLTLLLATDQAIAAALGAGWRKNLAQRQQRPAGEFQG